MNIYFSGDPKNQESLHYFNPAYPFNQFTTAIDAVGQIVEDYDADKLFPVYGFGGRFFGSTRTQDCHPLVRRTFFELLIEAVLGNVATNVSFKMPDR